MTAAAARTPLGLRRRRRRLAAARRRIRIHVMATPATGTAASVAAAAILHDRQGRGARPGRRPAGDLADQLRNSWRGCVEITSKDDGLGTKSAARARAGPISSMRRRPTPLDRHRQNLQADASRSRPRAPRLLSSWSTRSAKTGPELRGVLLDQPGGARPRRERDLYCEAAREEPSPSSASKSSKTFSPARSCCC